MRAPQYWPISRLAQGAPSIYQAIPLVPMYEAGQFQLSTGTLRPLPRLVTYTAAPTTTTTTANPPRTVATSTAPTVQLAPQPPPTTSPTPTGGGTLPGVTVAPTAPSGQNGPSSPLATSSVTFSPEPEPAPPPTPKAPEPRRIWPWVIGGAGILALIGFAGWAVTRRRRRPRRRRNPRAGRRSSRALPRYENPVAWRPAGEREPNKTYGYGVRHAPAYIRTATREGFELATPLGRRFFKTIEASEREADEMDDRIWRQEVEAERAERAAVAKELARERAEWSGRKRRNPWDLSLWEQGSTPEDWTAWAASSADAAKAAKLGPTRWRIDYQDYGDGKPWRLWGQVRTFRGPRGKRQSEERFIGAFRSLEQAQRAGYYALPLQDIPRGGFPYDDFHAQDPNFLEHDPVSWLEENPSTEALLEKEVKRKRKRESTKARQARERAALAPLRQAVELAKVRTRAAKRAARERCKRVKVEHRVAGVQACELGKAKASTTGARATAKARARLDAAREDQRLIRARSAPQKKRSTATERRRESDDEVRGNLPRDLVPVFDAVRSQIKGGPRRTRTEAFLEWAEESPDAVELMRAEAAERDVERWIAEYQRAEGF